MNKMKKSFSKKEKFEGNITISEDFFVVKNENSDESVIQYLTRIHKKSSSTITNGIQNAIIHGWRVSAIEDLEKYYTAKVNYQTGLPTPMELIYYYVSKVKKMF